MAIATLSVDLVARLASFESDLKKATTVAERQAQAMANAFGVVKAGVVGLVSALSVDALATFVTRTVNGVDALNDLADATGASIENLSALEDIARRTGSNMETVGSAVIKLNKALSDAKPDSDIGRAFKALNLNVAELKTLDPAEALRRVAVAMSGFADDNKKAYVVQELFGKSLREVAPLLNDLAKATKLTGTVTTEQALAAEKFNQQLANLSKNSEDAARNLLGRFLPAVNKVLEQFNQNGLRAAIDQFGESLGFTRESYALRNLEIFANRVREVTLLFQTAPVGPGRSALARELEDVTAKFESARAVYLKLRQLDKPPPEFRASQNYGDASKPVLPDVKVDPDVPRAADEYRKLAAAIGQAAASASEEIINGEKLSNLQQLRARSLDVLIGGQFKFSEAQKASIRAAAEGLDTLDKEVKLRALQQDVLKQSLRLQQEQLLALDREGEARLAANEDLRQQLTEYGRSASAIEALRLARLEDAAVQEELLILNLQNIEGTDADTAARQRNLDALRDQIGLRRRLQAEDDKARTDSATGAARAVDAYLTKVAEAGVSTEQAITSALGRLEDGLTDALSGGKFDVRNFVNSVLQEMVRLQVVRPLLASIFNLGGSSGAGVVASLISLFKTGAPDYNAIGALEGARANGGPIMAGRPYLVGERGPEIVVPRSAGTVLPNGVAPYAGGGGGSTYNINIQGDASENTVRLIRGALAQYEARNRSRRAA